MRKWRILAWYIGFGQSLLTGLPQTIVNYDYGSIVADFDSGSTNPDRAFNVSIWGSWGDEQQSLAAAGATLRLDRNIRFSGLRSQSITISRGEGSAGTLTLAVTLVSQNTFLQPPAGFPLLIRVAYRAEDLNNVRYAIRYHTGDRWKDLVPVTDSPTNGWQIATQVVPAERSADGSMFFRIYLDILLGEGACYARLWIDHLRVIGPPMAVPRRVYPNPIKAAVYITFPRDLAELTVVPVKLVIGSRNSALITKQILPSVEYGIYFAPFTSFDIDERREIDLYDYADCDRNHPEWFLLDPSGNRIMDPAYARNRPFYMDVGHPGAQNRVVERLRLLTRERYFIPEWIFFDNWSDWPRGVRSTLQYPDWVSLLPAWTSLLNRVAPVIHQELNAKLLVNIGSRVAIFLDGNVGEQWLPQVDGIMHEGAWVIYNTTEQRYVYRAYNASRMPVDFRDSSWISTLRAVTTYPDKVWVLLGQCDPNDREMFRFILASYLVVAHSNCLLAIHDRATMGEHTFREFLLRPEMFIHLGNAAGNYRVVDGQFATGALFARDFEYGIVLVNPTADRTFQYRTTRAYKDWDSNIVSEGTVITIGPRRGVILYAAPEITMQISPQQVTALPGETVTFTVQYRNNGLVDATNVNISVPLPEGLEFVSSSTGGQYSNRRITWTLPQVRVGQSGTLTFQARVQ